MAKKKKVIIGIAGILVVVAAVVAAIVIIKPGKKAEPKKEAQMKEEQQQEEPKVYDFSADYSHIATGEVNAGVSVHDPSVFKAGDTYYIYGSHMVGAYTKNLRTWTGYGNGYTKNNAIYGNLFAEGSHVFDYAGNGNSFIPTDDGGTHVWAPDVIYNKTTGLWYLYYCTTSTWNASNLCYGVSDKPEGPYEWKGALIYSGFNKNQIEQTNVLNYVSREHAEKNYCGDGWNYSDWPNALDPSVFYDEDGRMWMVYGSWSGGIFILELDVNTGEVIHPEADPANSVDPYFGKKLMGGRHKSIEGPYILYDSVSGYYYLFVSYGSLTADGGYQIRVFRSDKPDGDYVDMNGTNYMGSGSHATYGLKMSGNYMLPSLKKAYKATGHNSAFVDDDGKMYVVYHTRFANSGEFHEPRVKQFFVNEEGWPCMLPYATNGETISETGYEKKDVAGAYYVVNQGITINKTIAEPFKLILETDGKVYGEGIEGTWEMKKDTYYMKLTYNNVEYSGVFCKMPDEAGTEVMTFSAVGNNETIWGVMYPGTPTTIQESLVE